jgi:NAD(P)-dependent dehydrogenase (short-subunit alcohol dehydrogenase family)
MLAEGTLDGRVVVVTGGGTGLGRAFALEFARLGAAVTVAGRRPEPLDETVELVQERGGRALARPTDVREPDQVDALVAAVGIVLDGTFLCSRAAGRRMIEQGDGGAILSVIASYAWTGGPGTVHSAAAKAGVLALTRTLDVEWAPHGIRVNCICPGPTDTEGAGAALWPTDEDRSRVATGVPAGRLASPEEVAWWAAALCSPYAAYITGENLTIDGGGWLEQESYMPALARNTRRSG